jgi:hypothetical protein
MTGMSSISKTFEPDRGRIADLHDKRFHVFKQLQAVAKDIRQ